MWLHKMPESKAVTAGLQARNIEYDVYKNPRLFDQLAELRVNDLMAEGAALFQKREALVRQYASQLQCKELDVSGDPADGMVRVVYCSEITPSDFAVISDLGHQLASVNPDNIGAVVMFDEATGKLRISLRSVRGTDCSPLAKRFGGGGHAQSCGFSLYREEWDKL